MHLNDDGSVQWENGSPYSQERDQGRIATQTTWTGRKGDNISEDDTAECTTVAQGPIGPSTEIPG